MGTAGSKAAAGELTSDHFDKLSKKHPTFVEDVFANINV